VPRYLFVLVVICCLHLGACAGYRDAMRTLEAIHRAPASERVEEAGPARADRFDFAEIVDDDEIKEPVPYALDRIETIADHGFSTESSKLEAVLLLRSVALRSPSLLVRARALRALGALLPASFTGTQEEPVDALDEETWNENAGRLAGLTSGARDAQARSPGWDREALATVGFFAQYALALDASIVGLLREVVDALREEDLEDEDAETLERAAVDLEGTLVFLTAHEALIDPVEIVRSEAIALFFRFPWRLIQAPLIAHVLNNTYWRAPLHKIDVLKRIKDRGDRPENLDIRVMQFVAESLKYQAHAGVVSEGVELLKRITGLDEDDPGFWLAWWDEYLLNHAGERAKIPVK